MEKPYHLHVDLCLVHTPFACAPGDDQDPRDPNGNVVYDKGITLEETWTAMEDLVDDGLCASIGLSDVDVEQTRAIVKSARIKPAVVQVKSHPYLPQWELYEFCRSEDIVLLAFAALGHAIEPRLLDDPVIVALAGRVGKSPAQVLLAWGVQRGTAILTTSIDPGHIKENFDNDVLPEEAMQEVNERVKTRYRFNTVTETGVPGFIPSGR